jgi:KUP system potassium uptake protein
VLVAAFDWRVLLIDGALFSVNSLRLHEGGWFPLVMGGIVMLVRRTWSRGWEIVAAKLENLSVPMDGYLDALLRHPPEPIPGTAVFFRPRRDSAPAALRRKLWHNKVLHERIVFLTIVHMSVPRVAEAEWVPVFPRGNNCCELTIRYGFRESRDIPRALEL